MGNKNVQEVAPNVYSIGGKTYIGVPKRIEAFRRDHPISEGWAINTTMIACNEKQVIFRADIVGPEKNVVATGHAGEFWSDGFINRSSAIENCETSAIGRALAMAGYAEGESVASAEEVVKANNHRAIQDHQKQNQNEPAKPKPPTAEALFAAEIMERFPKQHRKKFADHLLKEFGKSRLTEINLKDLSDTAAYLKDKSPAEIENIISNLS